METDYPKTFAESIRVAQAELEKARKALEEAIRKAKQEKERRMRARVWLSGRKGKQGFLQSSKAGKQARGAAKKHMVNPPFGKG